MGTVKLIKLRLPSYITTCNYKNNMSCKWGYGISKSITTDKKERKKKKNSGRVQAQSITYSFITRQDGSLHVLYLYYINIYI